MNDVIQTDIKEERRRQDSRWGGAEHDDTHSMVDWDNYIRGHSAKGVRDGGSGDTDVFRYQMVRVAALAIAAIESVDRKRARHNHE
ncbi:hypothetical protein KAR91_08745 [Candidatus Pacearchaeota archaeon]|nr:hypothetical protein [Candidatus Pacearchaeota archaeon]